ncbi:MAG: VWA domain-containing protein [bacterium]
MSQHEITLSRARPLPVIVLADVSGSMSVNGKIQALDEAMRAMIQTFASEDDLRAELHVAVITFGGAAREHLPPTPAREVRWSSVQAAGNTPLGDALDLARALVEDRDRIPARAFRPVLVLVSDGLPDPGWEAPLAALLASPRGAKADRFAMAIGPDADEAMLARFVAHPEHGVFRGADAGRIRQFFDFVTMTVQSRSRSVRPDAPLMRVPLSLRTLDF